jgi:hypothetical protein
MCKLKPEQPTKTLRDEFAMAAMQGLLANPEVLLSVTHCEIISGNAYEYADAMMKAREAQDD